MKFARLLRATAFEGMPQMETLFSAYKALKVRRAGRYTLLAAVPVTAA